MRSEQIGCVVPSPEAVNTHFTLLLQAHYRQIRQWQVLYAVQAIGDKWRALERRKDRQRQAFDTAIEMATDLDYQSALEDARDQLDQAMSHEVKLHAGRHPCWGLLTAWRLCCMKALHRLHYKL